MSRKKLISFIAATLLLGFFTFVIISCFEISPTTRTIPPSREARINEYLALDRWLEGMGILIRTENSASLVQLANAEEQQIFLQSSLFHWTDEAVEQLVKWIEAGMTFFLVLDYSQGRIENEALRLLEKFGIKAEIESSRRTFIHDHEYPNYNRSVSFTVEDDRAFTLKDRDERIRLVQQYRGEGKLIVSGPPHFLLSAQLNRRANARLAWMLFAGNSSNDSLSEVSDGSSAWLFIRGVTMVQGLLGSLFRQGNMPVLLVSALVLLVLGFWAVIPGFGLVRGEDESLGKTLRERFLAEGYFLKKNDALHLYHETYMKEIKKRLVFKEGLWDDDIEKRLLELLGKPLESNDFTKMICDYKAILEKI